MTSINSGAFNPDNSGSTTLSQINHITRNIDKLMTELISVKNGTAGSSQKQRQQKIESQIRQLQTQLLELEHKKSSDMTRKHQQEKHASSTAEAKKIKSQKKQVNLYI